MSIEIESIQTIGRPQTDYLGWPTIAKTRSGELFIVYSGGRRHHVCPFGQVHLIRSADQGRTWTWPRAIADGPLDDRDSGILETTKGTLLVNWFSSLTWEKLLDDPPSFLMTDPNERAEWQRRHQWLSNDVRGRELGVWLIRSTDGGHTWSDKIDTVTGSPHGPLQLSDGRLLYPGKRRTGAGQLGLKGGPYAAAMGVSLSEDDGQSWRLVSEIVPMPGHDSSKYHELHGVEAADGRIVVHIRNHNEKYKFEVLQTESLDGGKTWSPIHSTGLWGFPPFLLRASDGRLITTFGHRREPFGNQIAVSEDHGQTWSKPLPINTDSMGDLGYPSTVEISPNRFLTAWYDQQGQPIPSIRLATWRLR